VALVGAEPVDARDGARVAARAAGLAEFDG